MSEKSIPIRASYITNRKISTSSGIIEEVPPGLYSAIKNNLNNATVMEFTKKVSKTHADSSKHLAEVLELAKILDQKDGEKHSDIYNVIQNGIIPKIHGKKNIKEAISTIDKSDNTFLDKDYCKSILEDSLIIDRIIANEKSLSKRFNFDKIAAESVKYGKCTDAVYEMCSLIDTYDISQEAKFNIALENILYTMEKAGFSSKVISEAVVDYFLLKQVIPDAIYETAQSLVKKSRMLSDDDKQNLSYFTESRGDRFKNDITYLAYKCETEDARKLIISSASIKSEKEASLYIKKAVEKANDSKDARHIISSIFAIPLSGRVSKSFVSYKYKLESKKNKLNKKFDKDFDKKIEEIINDEDDYDLIKEAILVNDSDDIQDTTNIVEVAVDSNFPNTVFMESEDFGESEDIKSIINDFKAEQKKSVGKLRYYLGKIYRKSPEAIIDETPNIFSIIRLVFILAPAPIPVIGPIISLIFTFIDKMLSMKINEKQSEMLIKKLEAEKIKVIKDIETKPDKKDELEKYKKCIESCIKKVDAYHDAIANDPVERDSGELDMDFGDDDLDFKLESTLVAIASINKLLEASNDNLTEKVNAIFNSDSFNSELFEPVIEVCNNCGRSINMNSVLDKADAFRLGKPLIESAKMGTILRLLEPNSSENTLYGIFMEAYFTEQLEEVINEGFNLNKLKLLFQVVKEKGKNLSTKEKAFWRNMDIVTSGFMRNVEKAMTSDRREGIIKGSLIPSFSKCMKSAMAIGTLSFINPILGLITAMGMIGVSKKLNNKERQLIYDEIDTELKVVEKEIEMANNDGDMKKYRCMLQYQKRLERERQRIKYGLKVHGRDIPMYDTPKGD